ncbi:MAG: hypothetical protein R3E32_21930 [Chitinophagales bacterium]
MKQHKHGNAKENNNLHHLYEIVDTEIEDTYKYGISGEELLKDGSSRRANRQVTLFNKVAGWLRFFARILLKDIDGREQALEVEKEYIEDYKQKNGGKPPRGND